MNHKIVHETIVRDIMDLATGIKDSDEVQAAKGLRSGKSFKSITSKSEALTLVFPVIAGKNMSYDAAAMVSKAIERKAVSMLHMLFSAANITDARDGIDYLSRFHSNLKTSGGVTVDDFISTMDRIVEEAGLLGEEAANLEKYEMAKRDVSNLNFYLEDTMNPDSIQNYKLVTTESGNILVREASPTNNDILQMRAAARANWVAKDAMNRAADRIEALRKSKGREEDPDRDIKNAKLASGISKDYQDIEKSKMDMATARSNMRKNNIDSEKNRLIDYDIKKANELVPSMMYVNFVSIHPDSRYPIESVMVIGIKAKLYAVDSEDILNRIKVKNSDRNLTLNLVKASTREISFFKDFIFALDKAKIDALSQSRRGSSNKIWKILERRALKSKMRQSFFMTNDATAISTLVLSQDDVEYLKKTEYIDVENPRVIRGILDAYNLMGFVIIDESLEIAKFIFDTGDDLYEILTFDNLEREQKDNSKKIINLMSKMNR